MAALKLTHPDSKLLLEVRTKEAAEPYLSQGWQITTEAKKK